MVSGRFRVTPDLGGFWIMGEVDSDQLKEAADIALARLRAHGQWLDVDAAALRFDEEETTRFLASACALAPTPEQSARLHAGTEGWAAALRLAALGQSLTGAYDTDGTRSSSSVFATLFEDLLESLPPPTVRFMAQTAVLERIHPDLCDAVCDSNDSAAQISVLLQYHLLTEPMDGEGRWLRYHLLLREHLARQRSPRVWAWTRDDAPTGGTLVRQPRGVDRCSTPRPAGRRQPPGHCVAGRTAACRW